MKAEATTTPDHEIESDLLPVPLAGDDKSLIPTTTPVHMTAGINISGDTIITSTAHLEDDQKALIRWAFNYVKDQNWGWREAANQLGVSENALYRVFTDRYKNKVGERVPLEGICRELAKSKTLIEERAAIRRIPFTQTSIWRRMDKICTEAFVSQTIASIYGESQVGKTTCLIEHARRNNHGQTKYIRTPAASGLQYFMREIAAACKVPSDKGIEVLRKRILKAIDGRTLVMIDELHEIFLTYSRANILRCLEFIREIHDRTQCGMVLCGTRAWREELETGEYSQFLKQLRRRGCLELQLPDFAPAEDLDLFAAAYHLPPAKGEARALILAINQEHGLGRYTKFLAIGARGAQKKNQRYTWDHFLNAYSILNRLKD
jgi:DNA transposition AAA+ family ATPase